MPNVYKLFDQIVEKIPAGSNNLIFTPWLIGERTPVENHTIRGGFYNLSLEMSREHMIRAVFEGVAYNVRWLFINIENFIKNWVKKERPRMTKADFIMPELNIIGGGANSNVWCQIFADVLNRTIKQVKDPIQANARGAALIAAVGLGYTDFDHIQKHIQISNVFKPNPENREIYDKLFQEFLNIYKITNKLYRRLNK
jgi:xylulokinase